MILVIAAKICSVRNTDKAQDDMLDEKTAIESSQDPKAKAETREVDKKKMEADNSRGAESAVGRTRQPVSGQNE
jgi:hypothetical protein